MKDLTGQRFGRLIAIKSTEARRAGSVVWECKCDCGNTVYKPSAGLCGGKIRSCGCLQKETAAQTGRSSSMKKVKNLIGQKFGRLVVIGRNEMCNNPAKAWECKCDCGNTTFANTYRLKAGMVKSCGCLQKEYLTSYGKSRINDLTGQRFGRLCAVRATEERKHGVVVWECTCDCGNTVLIDSVSLKSGASRSCGCLRRECAQRMGKRKTRDAEPE